MTLRAMGPASQLALSFETTWGTAPGSGFMLLPYETCSLGQTQPLEKADVLGFGREGQVVQPGPATDDGTVTIPLDIEALGVWLKLMFGTPTTTQTNTLYSHVFTSGGDLLPSASIEVGYLRNSQYAMNVGVVGSKLSLTFAPGKARPQAKIDLIGKQESWATASNAGTTTQFNRGEFINWSGAATKDGNPFADILNATFVFDNKYAPDRTIGGGETISTLDPGMFDASGTLSLIFRDTTLITAAQAGTTTAITTTWSRGDGTSLTLSLPVVHLSRPKAEISGPAGLKTDFAWSATKGTGAIATLTLVNGVATY